MKLFRLLPKLLFVALLDLALLGGLALLPPVQMWAVRWALRQNTQVHVTVGALSARFGRIELSDLRLERQGVVLTVPFCSARLPLIRSVQSRRLALEELVAKGWTLDFSPPPPTAAEGASEEAAPAGSSAAGSVPAPSVPPSAQDFAGLLTGWSLPWDVAAERIELEGDVLGPIGSGRENARVHLVLAGGGLGAGRTGSFTLDTIGAMPQPHPMDLTTHGNLSLSMDTPRTINRVAWTTLLSGQSGPARKAWSLSLDLAAARVPEEETYTAELSRGDRHLGTFLAHLPAEKKQLLGTWKIDLQDSDLTALGASHPLPSAELSGEGEFDADTAGDRTHLLGRLSLAADRLGTLSPPLARLGNIRLDTRFDASRRGPELRVDQLEVALNGARPVGTARLLQACTLNLDSGGVTFASPESAWLKGSITALPLGWLPSLPGGLSLTGDDLAIDFLVEPTDRGFALRPEKPLSVGHLILARAGTVLARDLALSANLLAENTARGWEVTAAPATLTSTGLPVVAWEARLSPSPQSDPSSLLSVKWTADLGALSAQPGLTELAASGAGHASGEFSTRPGKSTKVEGNFSLSTSDAKQSLAATFSAEAGRAASVSFHAPLKITTESGIQDFSTEGTWAPGRGGDQLSIRLSGKEADGEHLRLLALPWVVLLGGAPSPVPTSPSGPAKGPARPPEPLPFWGSSTGHVYLAFDLLKTGGGDFQQARGNLLLDHRSVRLETGQYQLADSHKLGAAEGSISFDPAAAVPYHLRAKIDDGEIDAAPFFGKPPAGQDPVFHGHFSVATSLAGEGASLPDLLDHTVEEFRLHSAGGIVRLLKTQLTGLTSDEESRLGDATDSVGTLVGKLAGLKGSSLNFGRVQLPKQTEAVLNFSYQAAEIGYSDLTIRATRGSDGAVRVTDLSMLSPDFHVTGVGEIAYLKGQSVTASPVQLELKIAVEGSTAKLLKDTGLLGPDKDAQGYALLKESVPVRGTLARLDTRAWYDLLFAAATRKTEPASH